jgi:Amidohydrolase family
MEVRPAGDGDLVLKGATVVDTGDGKLTLNTSVVVSKGIISAIVPDAAGQPSTNITTVDAHGKFLVPGFLDMHVHSLQQENSAQNLAMMLAYGITGVRQMAGSPEMLEKRRNGELDFGPDTPEVLAMPGAILTGANALTPDEAVAEVRRQKAQGADFIKTIAVSPKTFFASLDEAKRLGLPYGGHLSPGVDAGKASRHGTHFIEHLGPTDLLLIKCSSFELLIRTVLALKPPMDFAGSQDMFQGKQGKILVANPSLFRLKQDPNAMNQTKRLVTSFKQDKARKLADLFAKNETWQCPTLIRNETMAFGDEPRFTQSADLRYIPAQVRALWNEVAVAYAEKLKPSDKDTLNRQMDLAFRLVKTFDEAGVKMMTGTDYGGGWVIPGISLHQEFDLLERAGLRPLRILQMTTIRGAEFLRCQNKLGSIEEGKEANLVLLDANPLESVQHLHRIAGVVRGGRFYSQDQLDALKHGVERNIAGQRDFRS